MLQIDTKCTVKWKAGLFRDWYLVFKPKTNISKSMKSYVNCLCFSFPKFQYTWIKTEELFLKCEKKLYKKAFRVFLFQLQFAIEMGKLQRENWPIFVPPIFDGKPHHLQCKTILTIFCSSPHRPLLNCRIASKNQVLKGICTHGRRIKPSFYNFYYFFTFETSLLMWLFISGGTQGFSNQKARCSQHKTRIIPA